jgi:hypothetical protein
VRIYVPAIHLLDETFSLAIPPAFVFAMPRAVVTDSPVTGLRSSVKWTVWPISQALFRADRTARGVNEFHFDLVLTTTNRLPVYLSEVRTRAWTKISCCLVEAFPERSVTVHVTRFLPIRRTAGALLVIVSHDGSSKASVAVTPAISAVSP